MALMPQTAPAMPKDTTPAGVRSVKYRVRERTFVNGALLEPQTPEGEAVFVMAAPGLDGGPLEQVDPPLGKAAKTT